MVSNILFCITGPSGSGKTTIMKDVMSNEVGSCTSRAMREGEVQGREYNFLDKKELLEMIWKGDMAEWTEYSGNYYGTTKQELEDKLAIGHAYVICDNHGFKQFKEVYDNVVSIFLYAENEDCIDNMFGRGDSIDNVMNRLKTYNEEMDNRGQYDYVVKNVRGYKPVTIDIIKSITTLEILKQVRKVNESEPSIRI
jgi:guanylate kinase